MKNYLFLYITALFISLGGLLAGYDTGVISGALLYINQSFSLNPFLLGLLVSSVSLGAVFGALINGYLADKLGRKKVLIIISLIFIFGSVFCACSKNPYQLISARFILGVAVGVVSFVCPLYIGEISPKEKRGALVSFYQLSITLGILFSYLVNYFCANLNSNWRAMLFLGSIPALILFAGLLFIKESPRWLVLNNKIEKAKEILKKISNNPDFEIEEIRKNVNENGKKFSKKLIKPLFIGIGIMFVQIATGINAIIYYAPTILKNIGFESSEQVLLITVLIGLINFLMTFPAIILVDKTGRKPLLYIGLIGMIFSLFMIALSFNINCSFVKYLASIACGLYIVFFSMSLGPVALLLISEIFPLEFRARAMSLSIIANFTFNFIVTGLFPVAVDKLGGGITFSIFGSICILSLIMIYFIVPETKGKSLEEIERNLN